MHPNLRMKASKSIKKTADHRICSFYIISFYRLGTLYGIASKTGSTYIESLGSTVNDTLYRLYVGLPHLIGTSMRMAHLDTEMSTLSAYCTLCHDQHLLFISSLKPIIATQHGYSIKAFAKNQELFKLFFTSKSL